jgi:hypothetical protein
MEVASGQAGRPESTLIDELGFRLDALGWNVEKEPLLGTLRPDVVAQSPDGTVYLIEVKLGNGSAHFSALAQVTAMKEALETQTNKPIHPVIVTNMDVFDGVRDAAHELHVDVISGPTTELPGQLVGWLGSKPDSSFG